jgi:hypothetical protein
MVLHSKVSDKMKEGFLGGLFIRMGIVPIFIFVVYVGVEFFYLPVGLFFICVGCALYIYWHTRISVITSKVDIELRKTQEQPKAELIKSEKRVFPEDLCFEVNMKPGRENKPLMIVAFRKSKNFDMDKNEWVPKLVELEFLEQTLKRVSKYSI